MSLFASLAVVLCATTTAAQPAPCAAGNPHPAVVRVIAAESDSAVSYGSGTLVGVNGQQGLVLTNWHVVRDARGQIVVAFPDGFRSAATVLATDSNWDLAALAVWRPAVEPVRLADAAPRPGEPLLIAGYGSGQYRAAAGRCTQYVAPAANQPFEMVELSVAARQGDSGGPIFNNRGELAGVLFGSARGTTTGSYCGRVRWFLAQVTDQFRDTLDTSTMLATQPRTSRPATPPESGWQPSSRIWDDDPSQPARTATAAPPKRPVTVAIAADNTPPREAANKPRPEPSVEPPTVSTLPAPSDAVPHGPQSVELAPAPFDQIKTFLAAVGAFAILFHGLRLLSMAGRD